MTTIPRAYRPTDQTILKFMHSANDQAGPRATAYHMLSDTARRAYLLRRVLGRRPSLPTARGVQR